MIRGVSYSGIGVTDIDTSLKFYSDFLGFKEIVYDYTGELPGMDQVLGKPGVKARTVMLAHENVSPVATGMIKLVQLLPPHKPRKLKMNYEWMNVCIAEVCMDVQNIEKIYNRATVEKGFEPILYPAYALCPPEPGEQVKFAYFRDPEGILIELIEWYMFNAFGGTPRITALNHIGIGVHNMEDSLKFYEDLLGFKEEIIGYTAEMGLMAPMLPSPPPTMKVKIITNKYLGSWIELYEVLPPQKMSVLNAQWGDIGHMEFAIGVSNIEKEYDRLQKKGVKFLFSPQTVDLPPSGEWKYTYMVEPNGLIVSLVEY
jgi:catechol 2,3-dioxygenase-like lactoylglutathione lyase family enzyme